jgi:Fe-S oxidoreductase
MYNPRYLIDLIATNIRKTGNPFGVPAASLNTWWKALPGQARQEGQTLLFTGLMYQSIPYIDKTTRYLERFEGTRWASLLKFGRYTRYLPGFLGSLAFFCLTSRAERRKYNHILHSIYGILEKAQVDFFYRPELDNYSGILLYDLGDHQGFVQHARAVVRTLELCGVKKLITVDPHTTYALKVLYPKYVGASFEVKTYFELIDFKAANGHSPVAVHDPCFYGRYLNLSEVPLKVLDNLGIGWVEVRRSNNFTHCCGGPAESVSPALNREILGRRVEELKATGAPVVTMCPICLANLTKAGVEVEDLASLVGRYI